MKPLKEILYDALEQKASDIHLTLGLPPVYRVDGQLVTVGDENLTDEHLKSFAEALANKKQINELETTGESDFAVTYDGTIRMRCNVFHQQGHIALALRLLPLRVPTAEELNLPPVIIEQAEKPRGLVLLTGPTGSGKSSTLAAMLDHINHTKHRHIITLENPIEFVHVHDKCMINQREVGDDTGSFASGLRAALRQDPDVILVGEMRDLETISTAITAAETGHLVFGTLHTKGAANTIDRIIDVFPPGKRRRKGPAAQNRRRPCPRIRGSGCDSRSPQLDPTEQELPDHQCHADKQASRHAAAGRCSGRFGAQGSGSSGRRSGCRQRPHSAAHTSWEDVIYAFIQL